MGEGVNMMGTSNNDRGPLANALFQHINQYYGKDSYKNDYKEVDFDSLTIKENASKTQQETTPENDR